jgi:hypothetical protein
MNKILTLESLKSCILVLVNCGQSAVQASDKGCGHGGECNMAALVECIITHCSTICVEEHRVLPCCISLYNTAVAWGAAT